MHSFADTATDVAIATLMNHREGAQGNLGKDLANFSLLFASKVAASINQHFKLQIFAGQHCIA